MMNPTQLAGLTLSTLAESHVKALVTRIRTAMRYHNDFDALAITESRSKLFTPRLYTSEEFSDCLTLENLSNLQSYHCRSLLFATRKHTAACKSGDADGQGQHQAHSEWIVDVYPKGVWFQRCLTVYHPSALEVPERVLRTVRVAISTREEEEQRVKVGVLILGDEGGFEHVVRAHSVNFFSGLGRQMLNLDDVVDFDEINDRRLAVGDHDYANTSSSSSSSPQSSHHSPGAKSRRRASGDRRRRSAFLCGPNNDCLKIVLVLAPITQLSSLDNI